MKKIGITGHQALNPATESLISTALSAEISRRIPITAISSLAAGADQLFAAEALRQGGSLLAIIPSSDYEQSFSDIAALSRYRDLLARAADVVQLDFEQPSEEAYMAAGMRIVELADEMLAVWDGGPSAGLGGTADVVSYARRTDVPITVIWPAGASRG